jgi:hypothetical protein
MERIATPQTEDPTRAEIIRLLEANRISMKIDAELRPLLDNVTSLIYKVPLAAWQRADDYSFEYTSPAGNRMSLSLAPESGKRKRCRAAIDHVDHPISSRVSELLWLRVALFPERVVMERREADRKEAALQEELSRYKSSLVDSLQSLRLE